MYLTLAGSTASVGDLDGVLGLSDILATSGQTVNLELHYSSNGGIDFSGGGLITGILWGLTVDLLDGAEVLDGSIATGAVGANIVVGVTEIYTSAMHFTWVAPTGLNDGDLLISFSFLTGVVETLAGDDVGDFSVAGFAPVLGIAPTVFDPITTAFTSAVTYDLQTGAIADVPLPASALLLLGALGGLAGVRRMRRVCDAHGARRRGAARPARRSAGEPGETATRVARASRPLSPAGDSIGRTGPASGGAGFDQSMVCE